MPKLYDELALWWPLVSPVSDYEEEASFFLQLLDIYPHQRSTFLELGSGGGCNAFYLKKPFDTITLVDISPKMLAMSRALNPECEHLEGDMRSVRLGRTFDVVFVHDAIMYMTTPQDLRQAMETTFVHCKPGGLALFVPDHVRETFKSSTDWGGTDGDGRSLRYLEWSFDPDESDTTYTTDFAFMLREGYQPVQVEHDRHLEGLFAKAEWEQWLTETGFQPEAVFDPYERYVFVARKQ